MEIVILGYKMSGKVQRQTYSPTIFFYYNGLLNPQFVLVTVIRSQWKYLKF